MDYSWAMNTVKTLAVGTPAYFAATSMTKIYFL